MVKLTEQAAEQIRKAAESSGAQGMWLRLAARRGAEGIEYGMGFDDEEDGDLVFRSEGIALLVAPSSLPLLNGAVVDFAELGPGDFQFVFLNPNADNLEDDPSSCSSYSPTSGCGGCGGGCH